MKIETPILLIGKSGMLARAWIALLDQRGLAHEDVDFPEFDLTQPDSIARHVTGAHRLVVNCAAWTDVDGAEDPAKYAIAEKVNGIGVGSLAQRCKAVGATLVHYSTDYVFNGQATSPYRTDQPRQPLNAYGRSKALGEELLEQSGCSHLLLRTSWLYAPWANNFVRTIVRLSRVKPALSVVNDQRGRPTSAEHLARASLGLIERGGTGAFHVTDGGECTWFDFAARIVQLAGSSCVVNPCGSDQYPRPAVRPAYSVLDLARTESLLGPMPAWQDNLQDVMNRLEPIPA